jgi:hypothetical protein
MLARIGKTKKCCPVAIKFNHEKKIPKKLSISATSVIGNPVKKWLKTPEEPVENTPFSNNLIQNDFSPNQESQMLSLSQINEQLNEVSFEISAEVLAIAPENENPNCSNTLKIQKALECNEENKMLDEETCICVVAKFFESQPEEELKEDIDDIQVTAILMIEDENKACSGIAKINAAIDCTAKNGMLDEDTCECSL